MSFRAFVIGSIIGFGFGVYHGYNYAVEQQKKALFENRKTASYSYNIAEQAYRQGYDITSSLYLDKRGGPEKKGRVLPYKNIADIVMPDINTHQQCLLPVIYR